MAEIVTLGEPMAVLIAEEVGDLKQVAHFQRGLAGAELNVAVGLTRMGHHVTYTTRLGDDPFGHFIFDFIEKEGICTDGIFWDKEYLTGSYLKGMTLCGDPDVFYYRKNSAASHLQPSDIDRLDFEGKDWLHVTGISPALSDSCRETVYYAIKKAKEAGMKVSFDPNIRRQLWPSEDVMRDTLNSIASQCDLVLPGIAEGKILAGTEKPEEIAEFYRKLGCSMVVIKVGAKGAYFKTETEEGEVPGFHVDHIVDTVGAGDGFASGTISGLLEGLPVSEAVRRGNAIGAIVITGKGDNENLPDKETLNAFMKQ